MSEGVALQSSCPDETRETSWPAVEYETLPWHRNPDELMGVSKTRRRKILSTYEAAIPALIANLDVSLPMELCNRMAELSASLARFDAQQTARGYNLPSLLLRSESAASSQIENLTSSVRNITLAELSDTAPANARLTPWSSGKKPACYSKSSRRTILGLKYNLWRAPVGRSFFCG